MQTAINAILPSVTGFLVPMNRAPIMTNVQCTLGNTLTENTSATFSISGATDSEGDAIHYKIINDSNAIISFSKTDGILENETITISATLVSEDTVANFRIFAVDSNGNVSGIGLNKSVVVEFTTRAPNLTSVVLQIKEGLEYSTYNKYGSSKISDSNIATFRLDQLTIPDGETYTVNIVSNTSAISVVTQPDNPFSDFTLQFANIEATGPSYIDSQFKIIVSSNTGLSSEKIFEVSIKNNNATPLKTNFTTTLNAAYTEGESAVFTVSGGSDPDGDALTYNTSWYPSKLVVTKINNNTFELTCLETDNHNTDQLVDIYFLISDGKASVQVLKQFTLLRKPTPLFIENNINGFHNKTEIESEFYYDNIDQTIYLSFDVKGSFDPDKDIVKYDIVGIYKNGSPTNLINSNVVNKKTGHYLRSDRFGAIDPRLNHFEFFPSKPVITSGTYTFHVVFYKELAPETVYPYQTSITITKNGAPVINNSVISQIVTNSNYRSNIGRLEDSDYTVNCFADELVTMTIPKALFVDPENNPYTYRVNYELGGVQVEKNFIYFTDELSLATWHEPVEDENNFYVNFVISESATHPYLDETIDISAYLEKYYQVSIWLTLEIIDEFETVIEYFSFNVNVTKNHYNSDAIGVMVYDPLSKKYLRLKYGDAIPQNVGKEFTEFSDVLSIYNDIHVVNSDNYENYFHYSENKALFFDTNTLVRIPKFYYGEKIVNSRVDGNKEVIFFISTNKTDITQLHPAFGVDGDISGDYNTEYSDFFVGTHLTRGNTLSTVTSEPVSYPSAYVTENNIDTGEFSKFNIFQYLAIRALICFEKGRLSTSTEWAKNYSLDYATTNINNPSAEVFSWRGITQLGGLVNQYIEGLKLKPSTSEVFMYDNLISKNLIKIGKTINVVRDYPASTQEIISHKPNGNIKFIDDLNSSIKQHSPSEDKIHDRTVFYIGKEFTSVNGSSNTLVPISFGASTDTFFVSGWPAENKRFFDFNFLGVSYRNGAAKYAYRLCGYPEK